MAVVIHTIVSMARHRGGVPYVVGGFAAGLREAGTAVHIMSGDGDAPTSDSLDPSGVPILGAARKTFRRDLDRLVRQTEAGLLHNNGMWRFSNHETVRVARRRRLPLVTSPHGTLNPRARAHKRWKKTLAWRAYQRRDLKQATLLHAASEPEAQSLRDLGFHQPIAIVPNGVDLPPEPPEPPQPPQPSQPPTSHELTTSASAKRSDRSPRTALFLSRINPTKGLPHLVEAWARVRPAGWRLRIAGPDEAGHLASVQRAAAAQGVADACEFVGPVYGEAKAQLFREADLFILPTLSENFGVAVAEALAHRLAVITTRGAPWPRLEAAGCGWWTDIGAGPLSEAIAAATALPDADRAAMGRRGRALVEQQFTWPRVAAELNRVYAWLLGEGPKPACIDER